MPLYRLLYRSDIALSETNGPIQQQIDSIVEIAAAANARNRLSGALIASQGVFIQALEGSLAPLEATFERICSDLRHKHVRLVELAAAEERIFPEWSMVRVDQQEDVTRLCTRLGVERADRLDVAKAGAIITLMRSILVSKARVAGSGGFARVRNAG